MSNFPLSYKLSWLPRFLNPSLGGARPFGPPAAALLAEPPAETVRLVFLGDLSAEANRAAPVCDPAIRDFLASADLVIANCESPVVHRVRSAVGTRLGLRHAMDTSFVLGVLEAIGVEPIRMVLSLANNHMLDQGVEGFDETVAALDHLGVQTVGTVARGWVQPVSAGPLTVGLLAFTQWRNAGLPAYDGRVLMADRLDTWKPGSGPPLDLLCAMPHWDYEFRHFPCARTQELARWLSAQGAGLIVGHHAHVVQPVEQIDGALVAYGLGDFLGTAWARQPWPGRIGAMLVADISADAATRGQVAGYGLVPFMRMRDGNHERLMPIDAVEGPLKRKVAARLVAVYGG